MNGESHVKRLHRKLHARAGRSKLDKLKSIEDEFVHSWDWVQDLYRSHPCYNEVVYFLNCLREKGYHKCLRAGQSMWVLMLSRALHHGLKKDHAYIDFVFSKEGMSVSFCNGSKEEIQLRKIEVTPQIVSWLEKLRLITIK